jgi:hypothetical protein
MTRVYQIVKRRKLKEQALAPEFDPAKVLKRSDLALRKK